ncbi:carboxylate-amine ligase [Conexibacter woesei]|uniref:carboxylate-amine ligase n=1 Tax=Conexibacter woesei TaxID=191495 RepID=UPI0004027C74|nr:YbdK family carboxylate-amine ligase [Conexibacter woesei]
MDPDALRAAFAVGRSGTVGLEEELMLLDPDTLDLTPRAAAVLARLDGDPRFKPELPAAQFEIAGAPEASVPAAAAALLDARREAVRAAEGLALLGGAGVHPFAAGLGALSAGEHYDLLREEYAAVAHRQLAFGLHVHVAIDGPERALAVYNAIREHLPVIAALGAASPFYEGRDSGLASVRPKLAELLPRQGIPPAFAAWDDYARALGWGGNAAAFPDARWWWEARLHPVHGTLEVRVADAQATTAGSAALAAVIHALAETLGARHDAGELQAPAESWKIAENRWSAARHGVCGRWTDVRSGRVRATREHIGELLRELEPAAARLSCAAELAAAAARLDDPPHERARLAGPHGLAASLAEHFLDVAGVPGPGAWAAPDRG